MYLDSGHCIKGKSVARMVLVGPEVVVEYIYLTSIYKRMYLDTPTSLPAGNISHYCVI